MDQAHSPLKSFLFWTFQVFLFLVPVFFIPSAAASFGTVKVGFVVLGSLLLLVLAVIDRILSGSFSFPKTWAYGSVLVLLAAYALSAFLSANVRLSVFGQGLDQGSLSSICSLAVLFLVAPIILDTREKIFRSSVTLLVSFFAVALFELVHLVFPAFSLVVFNTATANMIGSWNDLGIFFGLAAVLSTLALEHLSLEKRLRILTYVAFASSLVFLAIIDFFQVWLLLGLFALGSLVYGFVSNKDNPKRLSPPSAIVFLLAFVFVFFGGSLGAVITNATHTSQIDVRPSWSATFAIAGQSLKDHPLLGTGPDRFASEWLLNKPTGVNDTVFWNIDFNYGVGFLPTLLITVGLVGFLGTFVFVVLFLVKGFRAVFRAKSSDQYLLVSSFIAALYLWIFACIDAPSEAIMALTFIGSGVFVSVLVVLGIVPLRTVSFSASRAKNFAFVFGAALAVISLLAFGYSVAKKIAAETSFNRGVILLSTADGLDAGQAKIAAAFNLAPDARYGRIIADIYLSRIAGLLQATSTDQKQTAAQFENLFGAAVSAAKASAALDPADYQNYLELAKVYGSAVSLKIDGASDAAKAAYGQALALNPHDPEIYYDMANLDAAAGDMAAAEADADKAISEKADYTDALYFLGLLKYDQKKYADAASAFSQVLVSVPNYANAEYFLGLSDYYLKDTAGALAQFNALAQSNPDNAAVAAILSALKAGKPLSSVTPSN